MSSAYRRGRPDDDDDDDDDYVQIAPVKAVQLDVEKRRPRVRHRHRGDLPSRHRVLLQVPELLFLILNVVKKEMLKEIYVDPILYLLELRLVCWELAEKIPAFLGKIPCQPSSTYQMLIIHQRYLCWNDIRGEALYNKWKLPEEKSFSELKRLEELSWYEKSIRKAHRRHYCTDKEALIISDNIQKERAKIKAEKEQEELDRLELRGKIGLHLQWWQIRKLKEAGREVPDPPISKRKQHYLAKQKQKQKEKKKEKKAK